MIIDDLVEDKKTAFHKHIESLKWYEEEVEFLGKTLDEGDPSKINLTHLIGGREVCRGAWMKFYSMSQSEYEELEQRAKGKETSWYNRGGSLF